MGRIVTGAQDPVVLYVSGGNTQVGLLLITSLCVQGCPKLHKKRMCVRQLGVCCSMRNSELV